MAPRHPVGDPVQCRSVAVDLKISQLVDVPNMLMSAFLPGDILTR